MILAFAYQVKCWREKNNISKNELALYADCSPSYIHRLESFEATNPQLDILLRICDVCDLDVRDFFKTEQEINNGVR